MNIYLPVAEQSVNLLLLVTMGGVVGMLSGIFGVGGGFLLTPLLLFIGISPAIAVGTEANQILGSSVSGFFAHWRRRNVDVKMGTVLVLGGLVGSIIGVWLFSVLRQLGHIDFFVRMAYVVLLGSVGGLMLWESIVAFLRDIGKMKRPRIQKKHKLRFGTTLPMKIRFRESRIYISVFMPLLLGGVVGMLSAILGVGGGFIMVPAMIYLLGMPTRLAVGTSLFQIIFVTANATLLQAGFNQTVDIVLALLLLIGSVFGAQFGARIGLKIGGAQLRFVLALLVLAVCLSLLFALFSSPSDVYSVRIIYS